MSLRKSTLSVFLKGEILSFLSPNYPCHTHATDPISHQLKHHSLHLQPAEIKSNRCWLLIHHLWGEKNKQAFHPSSHSLSEIPVISACARQRDQRSAEYTEGLWQVKNRQLFFLLPLPRQCLEVCWIRSVETQTRLVLCEQKPVETQEPRYTVISMRAAPHPPTSYRSARYSDRKAQK